MIYFLQGLTMGLAYVAPIGLQNLFLINTAITQKRGKTLITALIIIFFDITLALGCFFGIGLVMEKSKLIEMGILLIGSLIVVYIGIGLLRSKGSLDNKEGAKYTSIKKVIITACVVTWFNPQAIIDGTMMLGAFKATLETSASYIFIFGVNVAACIWFLGLGLFINLFKDKFTEKILRYINIGCGIIIVLYGIKLFVSFIFLIR